MGLLARLTPTPRADRAARGASTNDDLRPLIAGYRRPGRAMAGVVALYVLLGVFCVVWGFVYGSTAPFQIMPMTVPLVIMMGLIVWSLPPGEYAPTGALAPSFLTYMAALILWPNYLAIALPHIPWLTLIRITGTPLLVFYAICLSSSAKFRKSMAECLSADPWIWRMLLGVVFLQTCSIAVSPDKVASLNRYIIAQMNWTAIFFVSCWVFLRPGFAELWARMYLVMAFIICLIGLWEARLGYIPWAGHTPSFLRMDDSVVGHILAGAMRSTTGIHRVQSVASTPLGLAELLGLSAPFSMHYVFGRYKLWLRLAALAFIPLTVWVILLCDSRLGVVACFASVLFYLLFWGALNWRQNRKSLVAPAVVLSYPAIFLGVVAATFFIGRLRARVWGNGANAASTEARGDQWRLAIPKLIHNPFGYGIGRGGTALNFRSPDGTLTIDSYYIMVLMEIGVAGFILYFGMFSRGVWTAAKSIVDSRDRGELRLLLPLAVAITNFIIVKSVFAQDANHPLLFMMLGAVVALSYRAQQQLKADAEAEAAAQAA